MGEFKKSGGFGGGRKFNRRDSGRPNFGNRPNFNRSEGRGDRGPAEMFSATCSACHKTCEVPFRPSGDKPVYCSDCFRNKNEGPSGDFSRRDAAPRNFPRRDFAPRDAKPNFDGKRFDDLKRQLDTVTAKLDKLITLVGGNDPAEQKLAEKKPEAVVTKKAVTKAKPDQAEIKAAVISAKAAPKKKAAKKK